MALQGDPWNARFALALTTPPPGRTPGPVTERRRKQPGLRRPPADLPLEGVPCVIRTLAELRSFPLESRDAFVLSLVDGNTTVETILDLAGLPEDETFDILGKLVDLGALGVHPPRSDF
jgi:hypothetical protein